MKLNTLIYGLIFMIFSLSCSEPFIGTEALAQEQLITNELKVATLATNRYVAKTGNDSNSGTISAPFKTIQKGLDVAMAGDTVFVKTGTYQEYVTFGTSGTVGHPIVLKKYGSDIVTIGAQNSNIYCIYAIDKSNIVIDGINVANSANYNINIPGCTNITIKNLTSTLPIDPQSTIENIILTGSDANWGNNIRLENVTTTGGDFGILMIGNIMGVNVVGGDFSYASLDGISISSNYAGSTFPQITVDRVQAHHNSRQGINTQNCSGITIKNNHCSYNIASGIQIEANSNNTVVEDNLCEYNCRGGGLANSDYETGIWIFNSKNSIIRRNTLRGNQTGLRISSVVNFEAYYNIIVDNNYQPSTFPTTTNTSGADFRGSSGTFYNNTLVGNSASNSFLGSLKVYVDAVSDIVIKNNIIANDGCSKDMDFDQPAGSTIISNNNLIYNANRPVNVQVGDNNYSWSAYKTVTGQDANSVTANPLFISTTDFRLQATSPAIDAGVNIGLTTDYLKNATIGIPDIGAYEYAGTSTPPAATVYYNTQQSATATKSDCGTGSTGSTVTYTVAAYKYSSTISQADADSKATADLTANKQAYANANGTCTVTTVAVFYNTQQSATATKNDCGTGSLGTTVTYTVAANKYLSTVSQADADSKATADITANKQTYANTNGTCTTIPVYYNTQKSATATKNDCGTGSLGTTVTYTVAANKYLSTVSQADADSKATTDLTTNKQAYANANGTCTTIPVYYNTQKSATAIKNDCGTGSTGSTVTYTVAANKFSSTVSQADADGKATADLTANKQSYANANGTCTTIPVYYNTQISATATKNDCGTGSVGTTVTYTVAANKFSSTVSQADADNKATADLTANKQAYANANGTCTIVAQTVSPIVAPKIYYNNQKYASATKNDCGTGYTGSRVIYTVVAKKYSSTVSQADADKKATADLAANKQAYANANGTCKRSWWSGH